MIKWSSSQSSRLSLYKYILQDFWVADVYTRYRLWRHKWSNRADKNCGGVRHGGGFRKVNVLLWWTNVGKYWANNYSRTKIFISKETHRLDVQYWKWRFQIPVTVKIAKWCSILSFSKLMPKVHAKNFTQCMSQNQSPLHLRVPLQAASGVLSHRSSPMLYFRSSPLQFWL